MSLPDHLRQDLYDLLPEKPELLVLDFDGVLTDNRVHLSEDGKETVACSRGDGLGVTILRKCGLPILILSSETNSVVAARARKLKVECLHGMRDKTRTLEEYLSERGIAAEGVVFVGNDVNDVGCVRLCGCGLVVEDAHPLLRCEADGVLSFPGGFGAVREACELIIVKLGRSIAFPLVEGEASGA